MQAKVEELLKTNAGCELPCWWGIEPGITRFSKAIKDLSPLAAEIAVKENNGAGLIVADLMFPVSETISPVSLTHRYTVEKNIVQQIEVMPGNVDGYLKVFGRSGDGDE